MGNSLGHEEKTHVKRRPSERFRARMNSTTSFDTFSSKYSLNTVVNRFKYIKSNNFFRTSSENSMESTNTNVSPLDGVPTKTPTLGDYPSNMHSQATLISESLVEEEKNFYSSELVLKEFYLSPETCPERKRDRDRRHRQHYLYKRIWANHKIPLENPTVIVHWCCSTAVWDIEMAMQFPSAKVVGIDYETATTSGLTNTVTNFSFINANFHDGDTGLQHFQDNTVDYIMMRDSWLFNTPSNKWKSLLKEIYRILKPGGYIEIFEQNSTLKSLGPHLKQLEDWSHVFYDSIQYDPQSLLDLEQYLNEAGFRQILPEVKELPVGEWSETKELKETGFLQKDLIERRYREGKRWICSSNQISDKEFCRVLINAMDECEEYQTSAQQLYYRAQKNIPPIDDQA